MNLEQFTRRISDRISKRDVSKPFESEKSKRLSTKKIFESNTNHGEELEKLGESKESYERRIAEREMHDRRILAGVLNSQIHDGFNATEKLRKSHPNDSDRPLWREPHLKEGMYAFVDKRGTIIISGSPTDAAQDLREHGVKLADNDLDKLKVGETNKKLGVTRVPIDGKLINKLIDSRHTEFTFKSKKGIDGTLIGQKDEKGKKINWQFKEHSERGTLHQSSDYNNAILYGENTHEWWRDQEPLPSYDPPSYEQSQQDERSKQHSSLEELLRDPPPDSEQSLSNDSYEQSQQGERSKRHSSLEQLLRDPPPDSEQSLSNDSNKANPPEDDGKPNLILTGAKKLDMLIKDAVDVLEKNATSLEQNNREID